MSARARDIVQGELTVEGFRRSEPLHKGIRGLGKTPAPQRLTVLFLSIAHDLPSFLCDALRFYLGHSATALFESGEMSPPC